MKKWKKYLIEFVKNYFIAYLFFPIVQFDLTCYTQEFYWLEILVCNIVVSLIYIYFEEINPRKHIAIFVEKSQLNSLLLGSVAALFIIMWVTLAVVTAIFVPDVTLIRVAVAILWFLLLPTFLCLLFYRGVSVYQNKKIRVFHWKVTTYTNGVIQDVQIEKIEKTCRLHVIINGNDHIFWVAPKAAQRYKEKLQKAMDEP